MKHIKYLKCVNCGREHNVNETMYTCLNCEGNLDVVYDMRVVAKRFSERIKKQNKFYTPRSIWRYMDLLPIQDNEEFFPHLQIGWTPMYLCDEFAKKYSQEQNISLPAILYVKDDGRNPTASYKDRASAIAVVKALELGKKVITCASTGNAASSLAGLAASLGMTTYIFVPETAPKAKVAQLLMYGANVIMIKGTYDQAFDLCLQASNEWGWYSRNSGYNPYLGEGKKTGALEICEQLHWDVPDKVFVPVGDGCIIGGMWKGFCDLYELDMIETLPQMIGVQAEGAKPLVVAFETGQHVQPMNKIQTLADGIAVGHPRDALKALRAVRDSKGKMICVSDDEILNAMKILARNTGIFAEPAGAAAFAGLLHMVRQEEVVPHERVAIIVTGNGLKDVDSAIRAVGKPVIVEPVFEDIRKVVEKKL
jgi:threonine synthase